MEPPDPIAALGGDREFLGRSMFGDPLEGLRWKLPWILESLQKV